MKKNSLYKVEEMNHDYTADIHTIINNLTI